MDKFKENVFFLFGEDGGRLVEDEDFAVLGQRAQNGDNLALYGRHQIDGLLHVDVKGVAADQLQRRLAQPAPVDGRKDGPRRALAAQIDVFIARVALDHLGVLIDRRDAAGQGVLGGMNLTGLAVNQDFSGVTGIDAGENLDHRGFSGAVDAKQRAGFPLPERQAGAAKRLHSREALVDSFHFELVAHRIPSAWKNAGKRFPASRASKSDHLVRWWAPRQPPGRSRSGPG